HPDDRVPAARLGRGHALRAAAPGGTRAGRRAACGPDRRAGRGEQHQVSGPLLDIAGVPISFGGLVAVDDVDLAVNAGEVVGLIGPNGAGKTTVFNCISRFYEPKHGTIRFKGRDITRARSHEIIRVGIARTFQSVELCRSMTTLETLLVGQHAIMRGGAIRDGLRLRGVGADEARATARSDEMLEFLGLTGYRDSVVSTLPFRLQKLVELGRALVSRPAL